MLQSTQSYPACAGVTGCGGLWYTHGGHGEGFVIFVVGGASSG